MKNKYIIKVSLKKRQELQPINNNIYEQVIGKHIYLCV